MVNKTYLGYICTIMMLNELEIITWCYTLYRLMTDLEIKASNYIRFNNQDELVLATAILAKVSNIIYIGMLEFVKIEI